MINRTDPVISSNGVNIRWRRFNYSKPEVRISNALMRQILRGCAPFVAI